MRRAPDRASAALSVVAGTTKEAVAGVFQPRRESCAVFRFRNGGFEVWSLIGNLTRFPEYSAGLESVDATYDSVGKCTEYLCHFRPQEAGGEGASHHEVVQWYEPEHGFASIAEEGNAFGLTGSLTLVTLEPAPEGTSLTWEQYYGAEDVELTKALFDEALGEIGANASVVVSSSAPSRDDQARLAAGNSSW